MNKTYRNIWNAATGTWTAVAETAKSHSKGTARAARQAVVALALGGASVGGAFAADACTTADGTSGTVDEAGVCQAPVALKGARSIGTTAALDDTVIKVGGTTAATISGNTSNIAIGSGASSYSDPANSPAIALGWNANSNGAGAVAIGSGSTASATEAVALGLRSTASGANSMTLGGDAKATEQNSIALGYRSEADRANAVSVGSATLQRQITNVAAGTAATDAVNLGQMNTALATKVDNNYVKVNGTVDATATANGAIAIGSNAHADATGAAYPGVAIGMNSSAIGNSLAMGGGANAVSRGVAVGAGTTANVNGATAVGYIAGATADSATALGYSARAGNVKSLALGAGANVQNDGSVALGAGASTDRDNTVSIGSSTQQRQITNMAAGTAATDAVNVSQLAPVVTALGGGAAIDTTTGAVTGPTYNLTNGGPQTTVGGALGALDQGLTTANGNIAQNTADITTINNQLGDLASGTIGIVQQDAATRNITVAKDTDGTVVDFTGTAGDRTLTGVAAGDVSAASNEAVNGSQLHGVAESVASAIGGTSTVNPDGTITAPSFTVGDGNGGTTIVRNVGDAVTNLDGRVTTNEGDIANLADQIGSGTVGLVQQDVTTRNITVAKNTDGTAVDFTGTAGDRTLTGVAAGDVSAASNEAINGSQLHGVSESVASAIGGTSTVNPDGTITAPSFTVGDGNGGTTTVHNVGDAVTNLDGRVKNNEGDIANLADQIGSGTVGLVQQANAGADITVGANTDGAAVNFTGTAGDRKLTGVAAGDVSASSNEAVNGSQLHGVADSVASAIGAGSTVNPDGTITAPSFTVGDGNGGTTTVHNVGDVVTYLDGRVTNNEGAITHLGDQLASGQIGLVQQDLATGTITVGANVGGSTVNFAGTGGARTLTGVANGVNDSDAVTIAQLKATGLIDYTGKEIAAVTYDDISLGSVTFGGSAGTALHNVAPGLIAAGSMDAVNGGQLHDLQQQFAQQYGQLSGQMNDLTNRVGDLETAGGGSGGGMGPGTGTGGDGSLVVGDGSNASGSNSTAVGQGAVASGDNGSAFGQGSNASGENSSAIGQGSVASGSDSTAIGQGSSATGNGSVALGQGSVADRDNAVSVGSAGNERQITNVADGTAPTDAVNVRQLDSAMQSVDQRFGETNRMINDVAKNAYAGVAAAMAMPNLTPSQPGKTVVAVGAANYKSGSAVAAGATYRTRDGKWLMNGALSVTSTGDAGVRAQVGYEF
ncbi:YadA-like family protein [Burkholderia pyrrocinia]|nr:YadA-like family protein [Burkholderia pyrrocinia]EKS9897773.1 YadA-like family protein [Burkholderia pyrrocinia]EKS9910824.1 YadA-like family protein [Burkholderia pyrrocinia]